MRQILLYGRPNPSPYRIAVIISLKKVLGKNSLLRQAEDKGSLFSEDLGKYESCIGLSSPIGGIHEAPVINFNRETSDYKKNWDNNIVLTIFKLNDKFHESFICLTLIRLLGLG